MKTVNFLSNSEGQIVAIQEPRVVIRKAIPLKTALPGTSYYFPIGSCLCVRGVTPNEVSDLGVEVIEGNVSGGTSYDRWRFYTNKNEDAGFDEKYNWDNNATLLLCESNGYHGYYITIPENFVWQKFMTDESYRRSLMIICDNCQTTSPYGVVQLGHVVGSQDIPDDIIIRLLNNEQGSEDSEAWSRHVNFGTFSWKRRYTEADASKKVHNPKSKKGSIGAVGYAYIYDASKKLKGKMIKVIRFKCPNFEDRKNFIYRKARY